MDRIVFYFLIVFNIFLVPLMAQEYSYTYVGTRNMSLAGAKVPNQQQIKDYGLYHLGNFEKNSLQANVLNLYSLQSLTTFNGAAVIKTSSGNFAITAGQFGDKEIYKNNRLGVAYGRQLMPILTLGAAFNYSSFSMPEIDNEQAFTLDFSLGAKVNDKVFINFLAENPTLSKWGDIKDINSILTLGVNYFPSEKVLLGGEIQQELSALPIGLFYTEYIPAPMWSARLGVNTNQQINFGMGMNFANFGINISGGLHPVLGLSSGAGITYNFSKNDDF